MLPVYQNQGKTAIKKDLTNIIKLCSVLKNPQGQFKTIHVGGTNGKGTVSHMIASILQEAGYKVGLYTSPHYVDFRERIKVNGVYISKNKVVTFVNNSKTLIEQVKPSFFEVTVAMAFDHFRNENVDFGVVEVGLGGRLDSTNIITPELCVITNIGMDHMNLLGDTITLISKEKAGIIKKDIPVVIGEYGSESAAIFKETAKKKNADIIFASDHWKVNRNNDSDIFTNKKGEIFKLAHINNGPFSIKNKTTVITVFQHKPLYVNSIHIINGIDKFISATNYKGRWQYINQDPIILLDSGHNEHALSKSLAYLSDLEVGNIHFVLGFVNGKNIIEIIKLLPKNGKYYFSKPKIFRGAKVSSFENIIIDKNLNFNTYISVNSALLAAKRTCSNKDMIFVGGSSFVVGEVLENIEQS